MKTLSLFIVVADLALCSFGQTNLDDVHSRSLTFKPDYTLGSSGLNEWKKIGAGDWRAQNDDIVGRPGSDGACGLLMSERSFQDVAVNTQFKCAAGAEIGFVFRLEKTSDGWKGVLVSLKDGEISDYAITFDTNGKELKRDELKAAGGNVLARLALPPAGDAAPARSGGNGGRNRGRRDEVSDSPLKRPDISYRSNDWNQIEVFLDLNVVRSFFNDGNQTAVGVVDETAGRYGPIALFVGGTGEVRFRDIAYKDLAARMTPLEQTSPHLRAQRVSDMYYSWGAAAADFNKDGVMDIVAGPYIYFGPGFTNYCEIFPAFPFNPSKEFTDVNCEYAFDFTGDGWPDVLTGPPNATLYVNPKGESRRWDKYVVVPGIQTEVTVLKDIDGSGMPALIYGKAGRLCYAKPDPANPTKFIEHAISGPGYSMAHGIGVGDINGDGRMD
ncbi:MAG TPA: family 16 glycoside hydrolase, partial [Verrucomicrobiae bacterium]|nr:family 16 glycoside hydrolase [Verrucomicrobiae bacterium]